MQPLNGLFVRLSEAHYLLSTICEATQQGSTHQFDYACAVGEWKERRVSWRLNDLGISPGHVYQTVREQLNRVNLAAVARGTFSYSGSANGMSVSAPYPVREVANPDPHGDHWAGFVFENAVCELRASIGARNLVPWEQLPDKLHSAYLGWFNLPQFETAECPGEQFPNDVEAFQKSALHTEIRSARDVASALLERLRECLTELGCSPRPRRKASRIAELVAEHKCHLNELRTAAKDDGQDPFESLVRIGDKLCAVLQVEGQLPWPTRHRQQCARQNAHRTYLPTRATDNGTHAPNDLGQCIDAFGCAALRALAPTRLGDTAGTAQLKEAVAVVQQLAGWSFFTHLTVSPPDAVQLQRAERETASAVECEKYLRECWFPARSNLNTMQEVVRGWHAVQQKAPRDRAPRVRGKPGRKPRFSAAIRAQVEELHEFRKPHKDILAVLQNRTFNDAKDRATVATMTVDDIRTIRDAYRNRLKPKKGAKKG